MNIVEYLESVRDCTDLLERKLEEEVIEKLQNFLKTNISEEEKIETLDLILKFNRYNTLIKDDDVLLTNFLTDLKIRKKESFSTYFNVLKELIKKRNENIVMTKLMIKAIAHLGYECAELDDKDYKTIMDILVEKTKTKEIDFNNFILLETLSKANYHMYSLERYKMIIEAIDKYDLTLVDNDGGKILDIFTSDYFLNLDDVTARNLIELCLSHQFGYIMFNLMNYTTLSKEKISIIINKFGKTILSKHDRYTYVSDNVIQNDMNLPLFAFLQNEKISALDDKEFEKLIEDIANSKFSASYAYIVNNMEYNSEKMNYALDLIANEDQASEVQSPTIIAKSTADEFINYAHIAADLAKYDIPFEEYKECLTTVKNIISKMNHLEVKYTYSDDQYSLWSKYITSIKKILEKKELYQQNTKRLKFVLDEILNLLKIYKIKEVVDFASNDYSIYYNDVEFQAAINLIEQEYELFNQSGDSSRRYLAVCKLLVNNNVPFIDDLKVLFAIVKNYDTETINNVRLALDTLAFKNKIIYELTKGTYKTEIDTPALTTENDVLKLVRKNKE